jgi:hypothetical protein
MRHHLTDLEGGGGGERRGEKRGDGERRGGEKGEEGRIL